MQSNQLRNKALVAGAAVLLIGVILFSGFASGNGANEGTGPNPQPADKVAVAGSTLEFMSAPLVNGASSEVVTLFETQMKASKPTSLIFQLTAECAIWTEVTTFGLGPGITDDQEAIGSVKVWVELNGETVPVTSQEDPSDDDYGKVVFCNRAHRQVTTFEDEDAMVQQFQRTRQANAFNWIAIEVGSDTHTIEVKAELTVEATDLADATAAVGKRTLVVDPVKLPPGSSI